LLAELVDRDLTTRGWSLRQAENVSGSRGMLISMHAIDRMRRGLDVETETVIKWALVTAEPGTKYDRVLTYLRAAGKNSLLHLLAEVERAARDLPDDAGATVEVAPGQTVRILAEGSDPGATFKATPERLRALSLIVRAFDQRDNEA
jgi:hypothetical protein